MTGFCTIELPERLDIACVETLHLEMEDAFSSGQSLRLQGARVTKLDTAGLQILEAFFEEARKHHQQVEWLEPSNTIMEVAGFLQLKSQIGLSDQEQINE
ncbi:MAG: STAS domain-containing protein [Pseudomonadales bacterium]|nr:STAS domain-containing protein [Pseudomonadales bacterium]